MKSFINSNHEVAVKSKEVNFLVNLRVNLYGKNQISMEKLAKWCENHFERPKKISKKSMLPKFC